MTKPIYIVDLFKTIVNAVAAEVLTTIKVNETAVLGKTMIETIDYQYGHVLELIETLAQMDQSPKQRILKYPLVWLVTDFTEKQGSYPGVYADVKLHICIIHQSQNDYKATDRKQKVFAPVLYPIYLSLMENIASSGFFLQASEDLIPRDKTDRYYLGSNNLTVNKNTLNDYVDAIEIENLALKLYYNNC